MARECYVCGKATHVGNTVSHSNRKTKRRFLPNLQPVRTQIGNAIKRISVCTKCLKANKVVRAAA